ncbi:MAG: TetR/AcrR family transcriptional regulator [Acidimicrobiales bacterium]
MTVDDVSERIKRAALNRFVAVGFGSSTVDEIAASACVGVASLYRRWPDKAALANELLVDHLTALESALEPVEGDSESDKDRFLVLWQRLWEQAKADRELLLFVEGQVHAGFMTEEVAEQKQATADRWMQAMTEFGMSADPATATSLLVGTLTAAWQHELELDGDELGTRLWAALTAA